MRITRRNALMLGLIALLLIATWFDGRATTAPSDGPLLPGVLEARTLEVSCGDERVTLQLDSEHWTVVEAGGFAAYQDGVRRLLQQLAGLRTSDAVAENRDSLERLGLGESQVTRVRIDDRRTLDVGSVAGATYVHLAGEERSFRSLALAVPSAAVDSWIDSQPFLFDPAVVDSIELRHPDDHDRSLRLVRGEDGRWASVSGKEVSTAVISDWLRTLSSLVVDRVEFLSPASGESAASVHVEVFAGTERITLMNYGTALDELADANGQTSFVYNEPTDTASVRLAVPRLSLNSVKNGARALFRVTE